MTLLNIENCGVRLYAVSELDRDLLIEYRDALPYQVEYDDCASPAYDIKEYQTMGDALTDIVEFVLNPANVYAMDELPEYMQTAFRLANNGNPEIRDTVSTFLNIVLEGIATANER